MPHERMRARTSVSAPRFCPVFAPSRFLREAETPKDSEGRARTRRRGAALRRCIAASGEERKLRRKVRKLRVTASQRSRSLPAGRRKKDATHRRASRLYPFTCRVISAERRVYAKGTVAVDRTLRTRRRAVLFWTSGREFPRSEVTKKNYEDARRSIAASLRAYRLLEAILFRETALRRRASLRL